MKNYKITVQYDGTKYNGWQKQGNTPNTIQEKFENILSKMCGEAVEIHASGRTDAGVHAYGQVANFKCETHMECAEIMDYINKYLPADVRVTDICVAGERFHSRLNAVSKTYKYSIAVKKPDVFIRKYVFATDCTLDVDKMKSASKLLLGTHDFKGFSSLGKTKKSTVRTINFIDITENDGVVKIRINGSGFLYNMVRIVCGTLFEIGSGKLTEDVITTVLETRNRELAGPTLPACGLKLSEVFYKEET